MKKLKPFLEVTKLNSAEVMIADTDKKNFSIIVEYDPCGYIIHVPFYDRKICILNGDITILKGETNED